MTTLKTYGLALCGLGRMGEIHLENILVNRKVCLKYLVETGPGLTKAHEIVKSKCLSQAKVIDVEKYDEVIADPSVTAVIICTPTDTHEPLVVKGLKAGKHILCEKPLAKEISVIVECYRIAREKGVGLLCAFNRRFDPQISEMRSRKNEVGKMWQVKICSRDSPKPPMRFLRISGGIFHDCMVHDLDMARWILQEDPETIYSAGHVFDPEIGALDDVDSAMAILKFPSGVLAAIDINRDCVYGYHQTVELYGSKGNLLSDNQRNSSLAVNGSKVREDIMFSFKQRYKDSYINELEHLVEIIENNGKGCSVKGLDTVKATVLSQMAEDSFRSGKPIQVGPYFKKVFADYANDGIFKE